ncbi:MAG: palindromic element RPE1 domain-containing protein [Holosporales bacterium]|nr:palindromic element RPE1 domain-containing protein [Holosporales bacterium]
MRDNRFLSKPPESELLLGDTEHRSTVYKEVHEESSTGSTYQEPDCGGVGRKSNIDSIFRILTTM